MTDIVHHYRGDVTGRIDRNQMIGPDIKQRYLAVRSTTYDPATDTTTVKLRPVQPQEFRNRVTTLREGQLERERIRGLFNG